MIPDITQPIASEAAQIVEQFLRDCGVDETNVAEFNSVEQQTDVGYEKQIRHNGQIVGRISIRHLPGEIQVITTRYRPQEQPQP